MQVNTGALAGKLVVFQRLQAAGPRSTLSEMNNNTSGFPSGELTTHASGHQRPNPSIEGTHNGGAQSRAPSRSAAPLCAPHVKR